MRKGTLSSGPKYKYLIVRGTYADEPELQNQIRILSNSEFPKILGSKLNGSTSSRQNTFFRKISCFFPFSAVEPSRFFSFSVVVAVLLRVSLFCTCTSTQGPRYQDLDRTKDNGCTVCYNDWSANPLPSRTTILGSPSC